MNRRRFLKTGGGAALGVGTVAGLAAVGALRGRGAAGPGRPNVVFILADDLGWGDLACYGNEQLRTPNLDRLAHQGTLYTQFYVAPVCSPTRAAFLTGRFPAELGIHTIFFNPETNKTLGIPDYLDPNVTTVADLLKQAGYATAHFGKWHLGTSTDSPSPKEYGFDVHKVPMAGAQESTRSSWNCWDPLVVGWRVRSTEQIVDETIKFIEDNRDRPFYVQAWLVDPHMPLQPTPEQLAAYPQYSGATRVYCSVVTAADAQIGRLLGKLDETGLAQNTVFIFSSDNGPEDISAPDSAGYAVGSPGPFRGRKRSLYEGGIRVPFIVRWPAGTPARRVDNVSVLSAVDFLPTLCALAGIQLPQGLSPDGEDMSAAFRGQAVERRRPLMWEWRYETYGHVINRSPALAIRSGPWKLLMNHDGSRIELYDIPKDPTELNNLADRYPDVVKGLSQQVLLGWQRTLPGGPVRASAGANRYPWPGTR